MLTTTGATNLSLAASGLYAAVVLALALAAHTAATERQQVWHMRCWILLAFLFAALAIARIFDIEETVREVLRSSLRTEGSYDQRRDFQRPIFAALIALVAGAAFLWLYRMGRTIRGRRNFAAFVGASAGLAMVGLVLARLISLGPIDKLLYGPIKLNWIADIGLSILVAGSALQYRRIVRAKG